MRAALIAAGGDVNMANDDGLIAAGADVDLTDRRDRTPCFVASSHMAAAMLVASEQGRQHCARRLCSRLGGAPTSSWCQCWSPSDWAWSDFLIQHNAEDGRWALVKALKTIRVGRSWRRSRSRVHTLSFKRVRH